MLLQLYNARKDQDNAYKTVILLKVHKIHNINKTIIWALNKKNCLSFQAESSYSSRGILNPLKSK